MSVLQNVDLKSLVGYVSNRWLQVDSRIITGNILIRIAAKGSCLLVEHESAELEVGVVNIKNISRDYS